jgi:glycosyltransferase involved in cell wall biosynthesis
MGEYATDVVYIVTDQIAVRPLLGGQLAWLADHGWNAGVICGKEDREFSIVGQAQIHIVRMKRPISILSDMVTLWKLVRVLRKLRPAIVNAGTTKAGLLGMLASWFAGVPVRVYCLRGLRLETTKGFKRALLTLTEKLACCCAHRVICVSHSLRQKALQLALADAEKLAVIGSGSSAGVDVNRFDKSPEQYRRAVELRRSLNIPANARVVGFVGRLTRDKGIMELVESFEIVSHQLPDARLLLVGWYEEGDPVPANVRQKVASNPRIHCVGFVDNTSDYIHVIDVLALPTHREGFPNVALEAAAAEKPVAATRATGVVDAVVDGVTGLLSAIGEPQELAMNLLTLLTNSELAEKMGRIARRRVEVEFSIERVSTGLESFYLNLCHERGLRISRRCSVQNETRFTCSNLLD